MLRIHFTGDDLPRTRLAAGPDAMWEGLLSLYRLRRPQGAAVFGRWRRRVGPKVPDSARMLTDLVPSAGYAVDFLTPVTTSGTLRDGVEALRGTRRTRLRGDLAELAARHPGRPVPGWVAELAAGRTETVAKMADAVTEYAEVCLTPDWDRIDAEVRHDLALRTRAHAEGGWPKVLGGIHPSARWSYPVLELDYPADHDIVLDGRGLVLQPSVFCWGAPVTLLDPELPPVLTYPVADEARWPVSPSPASREKAVAALLGRTRARVLVTIAVGACNTTQLARRAAIPVPTASHQARVLREARLITTRREGNQVLHTLTPLGAALLNGTVAPPADPL
ncbi:ArsR/SmtB family transcription factor [Actinomadura harenae]|uniref:ArsR family transcriptional regulator n=1 Tax=Actinomadura harenae TaxID=2483351 RepID=A0A3M2LK57_9ACTN|nr:winged helix-turn-helix domain-containing protein [Actinomadura harenae]RMI36395.1 ArsR family transcriptional regulator [Actinomadura harenae]